MSLYKYMRCYKTAFEAQKILLSKIVVGGRGGEGLFVWYYAPMKIPQTKASAGRAEI